MYEVSTKDGSLKQSRVIDDTTILDAYMVRIVDLNKDGDRQLLVNNHEEDDDTNGVFAYSFPRNIWSGDWKKTTLASNFKNARSLFIPNMSPGFPYDFYPKVSDTTKKHVKPHIVVAGDGDHTAHIMTSTGDLTYDMDDIKNEKGTVGALAWSDLDEDDWQELWVPNYDSSYIEVFRFMEKPTEFL